MKKIVQIEGMKCEHCQKKVEDAFNSLNVKSIKVNLDKKTAIINSDLDDKTITNTIKNAGFTVVAINIKKGLFQGK